MIIVIDQTWEFLLSSQTIFITTHLGAQGNGFQITSSLHPRLKEAEDARTLCVSIENVECSGPLREALLQHAASMTELYRTLKPDGGRWGY